MMESMNIREEVKRMVDRLPAETTWDDVMHEIYVRQAIEAGLEDSRQGKVTDVRDIRRQFGLEK